MLSYQRVYFALVLLRLALRHWKYIWKHRNLPIGRHWKSLSLRSCLQRFWTHVIIQHKHARTHTHTHTYDYIRIYIYYNSLYIYMLVYIYKSHIIYMYSKVPRCSETQGHHSPRFVLERVRRRQAPATDAPSEAQVHD